MTMLLDLAHEQLGALRRALEARTRDMQWCLGHDPVDEGFPERGVTRNTASETG
jgi:hypothetical protein